MKRIKALAQMITVGALLLLTACHSADAGKELALDIRAKLLEATSVAMSIEITADYGVNAYLFAVDYEGGMDTGTLTVTAPAPVAGLKATVSVSGGTLEFDGAVLDTGAVTGDGLSPAEAVPVLLSHWQSGYISGTSFEKLDGYDTLAVTTPVTENVAARTWFDTKTHLPVRAELYDESRMVVMCRFENVTID